MNRPNLTFTLFIGTILTLFSCGTRLPEPVLAEYESLPEKIDYNFHVKPILADRCYQCHGPDEKSRKGGLRLDLEEEAFKKLESGNHAFVKGNPGRSEVIIRLISQQDETIMPPPESNLSLSAREIAILSKWVEQGAEWKKHWSFIQVDKPAVPVLDNEWNRRNEIDQFIQQSLLGTELTPNQEAQKEVLFRRVTLDLTGLPPTLEQLEAFMADPSENAYENWVDSLLKSDAHAERMAMEWMDIARYADSQGQAFDGLRTSWPYRDWLINAFKKNLSYKDFIIHQVAGDLLDSATLDTRKATAFYRLNPLEGSGGSIPEEYRVEYVNERAALTGTAFMGLTLECAKCHDHKFDPIKQREFFQIAAFFNSTPEMGLAPLDHDRPPTLLLLTEEQEKAVDSMVQILTKTETELEKYRKDFSEKELKRKGIIALDKKKELEFHIPFDTAYKTSKIINPMAKKEKQIQVTFQAVDTIKKIEAGIEVDFVAGKKGKAGRFDHDYAEINIADSANYDGTQPFSVHTWIKTERDSIGESQTIIGTAGLILTFYRGWELSLDSARHLRVRMIHRKPDDFLEVRSIATIEPDKWTSVGMTYDGFQKAKGITLFIDGRPVPYTIKKDALTRTASDFKFGKKQHSELKIGKSKRFFTEDQGHFLGLIDELSVWNRQLSSLEMAIAAENPIETPDKSEINEYHLFSDANYLKLSKKARELKQKISQVKDTSTQLMVMEDLPVKRTTYVLKGGIYNQHIDSVSEGGIEAVLPFDESYPKNRLGLAQWLTSPSNPLVSRVAVNRYWKMFFGKGLVVSAEDFGIQGNLPTHPELLDWLASDFMEKGWDTRYLMKKIVTSATYRQSSVPSYAQSQTDPEDKYLSYFPSYRYDAEILRDNALAASKLLVRTVGGKPTKPYQPEGLWKEIEGTPALTDYKMDTLENLYRRSMYTFVRRYGPNPIMSNFDVPNREVCVIRRNTTHTPLQALTLLNSPQFVEASRFLAENALTVSDTALDVRLNHIYKSLTCLDLSQRKTEILRAQYVNSLNYFKENPARADSLLMTGEKPFNKKLDKKSLAALTMVASTVLNSDESYMKR